ncbi:MAG: glycosyltransferase, partial [Clostridiales bacterium]|nr:glycosyltransferase [Clostridiales bacterium]
MAFFKYDIDLVYLWVDGNDSNWKKKQLALIEDSNNKDKPNIAGRYESNDELKYSLRSVEKHLPWIRTIFIITDEQKPNWLKEHHPKIKIIDHKDILPHDILPTFNSTVIELFLYKIADLSDRFLYANDDMFVYKDLEPSFFYNKKTGFPIVRLQYQFMLNTELKFKLKYKKNLNNYRKGIYNSIQLVKKKFGKTYPGVLHHNIDAYLREDLRHIVEEEFKDDLKPVMQNRFRNPNDIQRILFHFYSLTRKRAHLRFTNRNESCRIRVHRPDFMKSIERFNPKLFCLNDTEYAT